MKHWITALTFGFALSALAACEGENTDLAQLESEMSEARGAPCFATQLATDACHPARHIVQLAHQACTEHDTKLRRISIESACALEQNAAPSDSWDGATIVCCH